MRDGGGRALKRGLAAACGLVMLAASLTGQAQVRHATGLVPLNPAAYAKLPGVKRYRSFLKKRVDLSDQFPAPGDQQGEGACVAWATGYAARSFMRSSELGRRAADEGELISPQYVYSRVHPPASQCLGGIGFVDALNLLQTEGAVPFSQYPYDYAHCTHAPPESLKAVAAKFRIGGWRSVKRKVPDDWRTPIVLDDVKAQLGVGLPVVFAMQISPVFEAWGPTSGVFKAEQTDGPWHAMALVGYDEDRQAFKLMNSWGRGWGEGGYAWLDYATFEHLAGEAYVLLPPQGAEAGVAPSQTPVQLAPPAPAPPVRDVDAELARVAGGVDCAHLSVERENGRRVLTGFGGLEPALEQARLRAAEIDPRSEWRVAYHPWPQCEAELTLAPALARSPVKLWLADAKGKLIPGEVAPMVEDDLFAIDVETTAERPYLHVVYIQSDGTAVELYRGAPAPDTSGRRRVEVGAQGIKGVRFQVAPPFGDESVLAVASTGPLFGAELKAASTEREFLTRLRARLVQADRDRTPVSGAIVRLRTSAKTMTASAGGVSRGE